VRFIVDTGASVIALTPRDARKAGLDPADLPRSAIVSTANGKVAAGWVRLDEVRIERIRLGGVDAVVIDEGLEHSLLGMSFLSQLDSWQVSPTSMLLRQ
jgi:aspartyl protease family protein